MTFAKPKIALAASLVAFCLLAVSGCDFGTPIKTSSPTEVEGLTGTLVGPNGAPVSGAWVKIYAAPAATTAKAAAWTSTGLVAGPALDSIQTGSNGTFKLPDLSNGTYNVAASAQRNDTTLALFLRNVVVSGLTNLGTDTLKISGSLTLQVASGGSVVPGAQCVVAGSPYYALSDSTGACVLRGLPPGTFQITITHPSYEVKITGDLAVLSGLLSQGGSAPLIALIQPPPTGQVFPLTANTVALWTFNTIVDGTFRDVGPGGHDLPAPNGATLSASPFGNAVTFQNEGAQRLDTTLTLAGNNLLTYEARMRLSAYPSSSLWNGFASPMGNYSGLRLLIRYDGRIQVVAQSGTEGNWNWYNGISQAGVIPLNKWFNVAIAADRVNRKLYAYVDGVQQALYYSPPLPSVGTLRGQASEAFAVGNDAYDPQPFPGLIDEIRVSNKLVYGAGADMVPADDPLSPDLPALPPSTTGPAPIPTGATVVLADKDANIVGGDPASSTLGTHAALNFGKASYFAVGVYDLGTVARGLARFRIPQGVSATRIQKAVIRIHSSRWLKKNVTPDSVTLSVHRLLRDWKEGSGSSRDGTANSASVDGVSATERYWGSQNGSEDWNKRLVGLDGVDAAAASAATATRANGYLGAWDFDVTDLAKSWAGDSTQNFGVVFSGSIPASNALAANYPEFISKDTAVADGYKPMLILTTTADTTPTVTQIPDPSTWTVRSSGDVFPLYAVIWNDSLKLFVAVGSGGTIRTSPDGITWTARSSGIFQRLLAVTSRGNVIVAVGDSGTVLRSTDGVTWSERLSNVSGGLYAVAATSGLFIAMGQNGVATQSADGQNWTPKSIGTTNNSTSVYSIVAEADSFVATGANGLVMSSPDGLVWKTGYVPSTGTTNTLYSVAWYPNGRMAVGGAGTILTFSDGTQTWNSRTSSTTQPLYAQSSYSALQRVVVGGAGTILSSGNGITWTSRTSGTTQALYGVARNADRYVAVGANGVVVTSATAPVYFGADPVIMIP